MECYAVVNRVYLWSLILATYIMWTNKKWEKNTFQPECRTSYIIHIIPLYIIIVAQTINGLARRKINRIVEAHESRWKWKSVESAGAEVERRWDGVRAHTWQRDCLTVEHTHSTLTITRAYIPACVCVYMCVHCTLLVEELTSPPSKRWEKTTTIIITQYHKNTHNKTSSKNTEIRGIRSAQN